MRRTLALLAALAAAPAFAADAPSFDCAKADSAAETLICQDADLAALDRLVAGRYAAALAAIRAMGAGAQDAENTLRAEQRGWIKGRDECWKAAELKACVEDALLRREGALVAAWMLEAPTNTAFWACGDTPANEVATMFFDTTLPSVRFERGDSIDTGSRAPTASGARYEGAFGRSIWIKGDAATYRDPNGETYDCVLTGER